MDERLARVIVSPSATLREALKTLDASAMRVVLVSDEGGPLLGILTDGDVRRWILGGRGLEGPVSDAMTVDPVTVTAEYSDEDVRRIMVDRGIDFLPVVDAAGCPVSAVRWTDLVGGRDFDSVIGESGPKARASLGLPVVIMAGGKGSRLAPFTKVLPKPLVPVGEKPVTEIIMDRFAGFGCDRFIVSLNYQANLIRAYFADAALPYTIDFVEEQQPLGTAGSLSLMGDQLARSTFFVTNCDILVDADYADVLAHHRDSKNVITLVASVKHFTVPYGVCKIAEGGQLVSMVEKPEYDHLVSTGFYVVEPEVLSDIPEGSAYHLTDLINSYLEQGRRVGVYPISEKSWFDIGQMEELRATLAHFDVE